MTANGWTYDPVDQVWSARTGPNTWTLVPGDLDDPPTFRSERIHHA
jgi:hypothetical protein